MICLKMYNKKVSLIKKILINYDIEDKAIFNKDLQGLTSIGTGGRCICFLIVDNRKILIPLIKDFLSSGIDFYILGGGTNILFADGLVEIVLLRLGSDFNYIQITDGKNLTLGAAYKLQKFVVDAARANIDFSFLAGIPGTVGGAVICSSGTASENINNYVKKIKYISVSNGNILEKEKNITNKDYNYRSFNVDDICVLTDIFLEGLYLEKNLILSKVRKNIKAKKESQPLKEKSAGCFFKNPMVNTGNKNLTTGEIIEKCGFKGFGYGGAKVSELHSNFIVNFNRASSKDIMVLSKIIKEIVKDKFKIELEYEVKLVGFK